MSKLRASAGHLPDLEAEDLETLQHLLDATPAPLTPLDLSSLDGFICGVLLQPDTIEPQTWLPHVTDIDARAWPEAVPPPLALHQLVLRRAAVLQRAIAKRDWFDPWVFELEGASSPSESVLPWVAGFAAAMDAFPALLSRQDERLLEPLALLYIHFDADDLDDAEALLDFIDTLQPPADLAEAVQDIVRSLMLIADVVRPRKPAPTQTQRRRPSGRRRPR